MLLLIHIALMAGSFLLIASGVLIAMFQRKNPAWLKRHKALNASGAVLALAGCFCAVLGIFLAQADHFRVVHAWVGLIVIACVLVTPLVGQLMFAAVAQIAQLRPWHIRFGRATLALMVLNIVLGINLIF
jgi:hypothetical membrane protein